MRNHWLLTLQLYLVSALIAGATSLGVFASTIIPLLNQREDARPVRILDITAYSPRIVETDSTPFINACMTPVALGQVAVSKDLWIAGYVCERRVWIQDLGIFVVMDRMNSRFRDRIDIFFFSTQAAREFGHKKRVVALLGRNG